MTDKKSNNGKNRNKINCNTCLALVSLFYSSAMSSAVREAIIYHLIKCDKCLARYVDYESKHEEYKNIKIKAVISLLRKNLEDLDVTCDNLLANIEITSSFSQDSNSDGSHFNPTKWQDAAATFDIETLMNLKFFRDLISSYDYTKSYSDIDYSGFYKHISRKIAKRVDLLEVCFRKEYVTNS